MDSIPLLTDYAPETLVGVFVLLVFFGLLVPYRFVKRQDERIKFLESALETTQKALQDEQKTGEVVRHFFEGLNER